MAFWSIAVHQPMPASHTEFRLTIPGGGSTFPSSGMMPMARNSAFNSEILLTSQLQDATHQLSPLVGSQGHDVQPNETSGHNNSQPL